MGQPCKHSERHGNFMTHFESLFLVLLFYPLSSRSAQVSRVGWGAGWDRPSGPVSPAVRVCPPGPRRRLPAAALSPLLPPRRRARRVPVRFVSFVFLLQTTFVSPRTSVDLDAARSARCHSGQCDTPVSSDDPSCGVTPCALVQLCVV